MRTESKSKTQKPSLILALSLAAALAITGCTTKKREVALPYGADKDLLVIADYADKEFTIQTKEIKSESQDKKGLKVKSTTGGKSQVRAFDFVKYDASNDSLKLLDESLMLGKTNHTYKMKYVFDGTLIKVFKLGSKEDWSMQELAAAEANGNKVPVVAYSVSYFTLENQRNEKDETTRTLKLVEQNSASAATHFKINYNSKELAKFITKDLVFDSKMFDGDWYYAQTVTSQNYRHKSYQNGYMFSLDDEFNVASKVRSQRTNEKSIEFINLNVDSRIKEDLNDRKENQNVAFKFEVESVDYRMVNKARGTGITEEAYSEGAWDQRPYIKVKFAAEAGELIDVQVSDGYVSFLFFDSRTKSKVRTSLYNVAEYQRIHPKYEPKVYFKEDKRIFGFFDFVKNTLKTGDRFRREDFEKDTVMTRYNPKREKIVFSLNPSAPAWTVELAQRSVDAWAQAFSEAGIKTQLELSKERAEVGDLRANVINMIGDIDGGEPYWGIAPKIVDSDTGEIVSSTSNINLMSIIYRGDAAVEQYLRARSGVLDKSYVMIQAGAPAPSLELYSTPLSPTPPKENSKDAAGLSRIATQNILLEGIKLPNADTKTGKIIPNGFVFDASAIKKKLKSKSSLSAFHSEATFEITSSSLIPEIDALCPKIKEIGDKLAAENAKEASKSDVDRTSEEFKKIKRACSMEISKPRVIATLIHEMGHNFGLRHNFRGSNDWINYFKGAQEWKNYLDEKTGKSKLPQGVALGAPTIVKDPQGKDFTYYSRSSSIMEYPTYDHDTQLAPGPYDIAALRWGYTNVLFDREDKSIQTTDAEPIAKQLEKQKKAMRSYAYCTDEDVDDYAKDSGCIRGDQGLTPVQVVENATNRFNLYLASSFQKLDREEIDLDSDQQIITFKRSMEPLLKIYQDWRSMVAAEVGSSNSYLEKANVKDYVDFLARITTVRDNMSPAEKAYRMRLASYRKAADLVYNFLNDLIFVPDYACVANRSNGKEEVSVLFSFANLQKDVHSNYGVTPKTCMEASVQDFLKNSKKAKLIGAGGLPLLDLRYDLDKSPNEDDPDRKGLLLIKLLAADALASRKPLLAGKNLQFIPNFLDEPHYRMDYSKRVTERMQLGVDLSAFNIKTKTATVSPLFENEKVYLPYLYLTLKQGTMLPNEKESVNNKRLEPFAVRPSYLGNWDDTSETSCVSIQSMNLCAGKENYIAKSLITSLVRIQRMQENTIPSQEAKTIFLATVKPFVPAERISETTVYPAEQFMKMLDAITAARRKLTEEKKSAVAKELGTLAHWLLSDDTDIFNHIFNRKVSKANGDSLTDQEFLEKREALMKLDVLREAKLARDSYGDKVEFELSYPILEERLKDIAKIQAERQAAYLLDQTELDAQGDVLMKAILGEL